MPLVIGAIAAVVGFAAGRGFDGAGKIVQWGVIGAAGYLAYQHFKR